jgi:hypothetical protein
VAARTRALRPYPGGAPIRAAPRSATRTHRQPRGCGSVRHYGRPMPSDAGFYGDDLACAHHADFGWVARGAGVAQMPDGPSSASTAPGVGCGSPLPAGGADRRAGAAGQGPTRMSRSMVTSAGSLVAPMPALEPQLHLRVGGQG